jgi:hypothetical protein
MLTAYWYLHNGWYLDVPHLKEWELFEVQTGPPCIYIQMQNYLDYSQ